MELFKTVVENYEYIIDNDSKQYILKELKYYFKSIIESREVDISHIKDKNHLNDINSGTITVYYIQNFAKARDIFEKGEIIKHFMKTNIYGIKEVVKREFTFIQMIEVSTMEAGTSFGEYALLNKKKRSASVRTLEKTHFATLDSEAFNDVMLQIKKKESDMKVDFLNMYTFLY